MEFSTNKPPASGLHLHKKRYFWIAIGTMISVFMIAIIVGCFVLASWYSDSLQPKDPHKDTKVRFTIEPGQSPAMIADNLEKKDIIRSSQAFELYLKLKNKGGNLQAGTYALSPNLSVEKIVTHLEEGKTDLFNVTILPGATLDEIKEQFKKYGFTDTEIKKAYQDSYNSPLLADKPKNADLEGYIFPETFELHSNDTLHTLLERDFDTLYRRLSEDGLVDKFKARGLSVYQALTLASVIQKEASAAPDQPQIAQVFYTRLQNNMKLESDVTFHYAAKKLGVAPNLTIDSPYNTRKYPGLPPGPIANVNYSALKAVADPAPGDYVFFIAGDDGVIYYAHSFEEHEENIAKYCHKLCGNAY